MSKVEIDVGLNNSGIDTGLKEVKGKFGGLGDTLKHMGKTIAAKFWEPFDIAATKVLAKQYGRVSDKLRAAVATDDDINAQALSQKQAALYDRISAARERLALASQSSSQKQATTEEQTANRIKMAFSAAFAGMKTAATSFRNAFTKAFSGLRSVVKGFSKIVNSIKSKFTALGKTAGTFGTRLRSIIGGALVFNAISAGLRRVTEYFRTALMATKEMKDAMANLRGATVSAAAPIIQLLVPALSRIVNAIAVALAYIGQFATALTGKIGKAANKAAKGALSGAAKAAGAAKKVSKSLAGFDEITKLNDKDGGGAGGAKTPAIKTPDVSLPDWAKTIVDNLKAGKWAEAATVLTDKLNSMVQSVDWKGVGKKIAYWMDGALTFLATAILTFDWYALGKSLATSINEIINNVDWTNLGIVLGAEFIALVGLLGGAFAKLDWEGIGSAISSSLMGLWNAIDWQLAAKTLSDGVIGIFVSLGEAIKNIDWQKIGNDIVLFLSTIDWAGIATALSAGIGAALAGLAALLWGLIEDAWDIVVGWWQDAAYKDGEFTIEGLLDGIWSGIKNIGKWINEKIFKPFIEGFESAFKIHSPSKAMEEEGGFVIAGLFNGITNAWNEITRFFENAVRWFRTIFGNLTKIAGDSWRSIQQTWAAVSGWFNQTIIAPLTQAFTNLWSNLSKWATDAWAGIRKVFGSVGDWFGKTFGDAWEKVKKVFSSGGKVFDGIKDGIVSSFKSIVNKLISGINRVVAKPFEGLNSAIRKIRNVNVLGMTPFSGLSTVSVPSIPYLAQGAVLPANKPFMAVVGDQRHGTNVEAPLTTIQEAVANVMGDQVAAMMAGFNALLEENQLLRQVVENIELGDSTIGQAAERYQLSAAITRGV